MDWLLNLLSGGKTGAARDAADLMQGRAGTEAEDALRLQREAKRRAELAAVPAADKESTILAGEAQMRKLLAAAGVRYQGQPTGAATLGFSALTGQ